MPFIPKIVAVSETWMDEKDRDEAYELSNYSLITSLKSGRGRGTALYLSNNLPYKVRPDISIDTHLCDSVYIELLDQHSALSMCVYRLHIGNVNLFCDDIKKALENMSTRHRTLR